MISQSDKISGIIQAIEHLQQYHLVPKGLNGSSPTLQRGVEVHPIDPQVPKWTALATRN